MIVSPVSVFDVAPDYRPIRIRIKSNCHKVRVQCRECGTPIILDATVNNIHADYKCCICDGASVTSAWG